MSKSSSKPGISVLTSINLEYIAEQQDFVRSVLGTTKAETVPQDFIDRADEVVVVDAPPEAATGEEAQYLSQLRQRALLLTADVVDRQLEGIPPPARHSVDMGHTGAHPRLHDTPSQRVQNAGEWSTQCGPIPRRAVCDLRDAGESDAEDRLVLARNVTLARAQQAKVETLEGKDPIETILEYARAHGITQILSGHNLRGTWRDRLGGSP